MIQLHKNDELLVFRSAGIGDFLVILPFINYLINIIEIPKKNIHFVIINNQNLNPFKLVFEKDDFLVQNSLVLNPAIGISELKKIKSIHRDKKFTKVIYLPFMNEPMKSKVKKLFSIKYVAGIRAKIFGINFKKQEQNIGTQYLTYFEQLGLQDINQYLDFHISDIINFSKKEIVNTEIIKLDKNKKNIALYINSKLEMKVWDKYNYFKIIEYISNNYDANVYLIGANDDIAYHDSFVDEYNLSTIHNIAGRLSIRETILLLDSFDLLIGNDGSPLHMAAYSDCAILGLYTYKEEITSWEPYKSSKFIALRKNVSCKHCYLEFCEDTICLSTLGYNEVFKYINILLNSKKIKQSVVIY